MTKRSVPDWLLERLARGELPPDQARALHAELAATGQAHRLTELSRSNDEILTAHPPRIVADAIRRRSSTRRRPWFVAAPVLALVGSAAVVALMARPQSPRGPDDDETITLKGLTPSLRIYRKTATGAVPLTPGARMRPGDTLQVAYLAAGRRFGVIASLDSRGAVSWHLSDGKGKSPALSPSGERAVPASFELDATPGVERFVFLAADDPFPVERALPWLQGAEKPPRAIVLVEFTVTKEIP